MGKELSAVILLPLSAGLPWIKKAYFFRQNEYIRYDVLADAAVTGYPKEIAKYWPGIWGDGIDAAAEWPNKKVYFFKGKQYIRYDIAKDKADPGYPRRIVDNWPGIWPDGIDAVLTWPNGKAYFFKGKDYIRFDIANKKADPGYPKPIAKYWKGLWAEGINAAVLWPNGKAYFFKGNNYIRYDVKNDKADPGYPKPISGNWPGIWETYQFKFMVFGVPDTDQRWTILSGEGKNHCVPTASYNWLEYLNDLGIRATLSVPTGPLEDILYKNFNRAIWNISLLGAKMKTNSEKGTSHAAAFSGLLEWCNDRKMSAMILGQTFSDDSFLTRARIKSYLLDGALLTLCFGRWCKDKGSTSSLTRKNGHCLTLVGVTESKDEYTMSLHDPWTDKDDSKITQSKSEIIKFNPTEATVKISNKSVNVLLISEYDQKKIFNLAGLEIEYGDETVYCIFDTLLGILPSSAWTINGNLISWTRSDLSGNNSSSGSNGSSQLPFKGEPKDLAIHPSDPWLVVVGDPNSGDVWQYNRHTDNWSILAQLAAPVERLVYGGTRSPRLYAAHDSNISMLHTRTGKTLKKVSVGLNVAAMAWDHTSQELVFTDVKASTLFRADKELRLKEKEPFKAPTGKGRLDLSVRKSDGAIYASREGSSSLITSRLQPKRKTMISTQTLDFKGVKSSVQVALGDRFIASVGGKFMMYDKDGKTVANNPFEKMKTGSLLRLSESWENLKGLEWYS